MTRLLPEHFERSPQEVSRILVLSLLDNAVAAAERLNVPDGEALHDFRVALRRLRSSIRAYRRYLDNGVSKKTRKELRRLATSTNAARDVEVQLAWLGAQSDQLNEKEGYGLAWLVKRLDQDEGEPRPERFERIRAEISQIRKTLAKSLSSWRMHLSDVARGESFRKVIGSSILEHVETLNGQLRAIGSADEDAQAHAARISAKRLRYLLEPLSRAVPQARPFVERLKELQDLLGDLHDTNVLVSTVGSAMEASALEKARRLHQQALQASSPQPATASGNAVDEDERDGLLALARLLRQRRETLFAEIDSRWHGDALDRFVAEARAFGIRLRVPPGNAPHVRRFRLTGLPDIVQSQAATLIDEGWLPGQKIEDCVRREQSRSAVRHYRRVRVGSERRQIRIPRRIFASLWPLTDGRRLRKERYQVVEGGRLWRVDHLGGNVVLAETETTSEEEELRLPAWLAPYLREELTGPPKTSPPVTSAHQPAAKGPAAPEPNLNVEPYVKPISGNGQGNHGSTPSQVGPDSSVKTERDG